LYGHIHYGLERAKTMADFKAVSMNAMHSSMKITDEFYSNLNDGEVQKRINSLGKDIKIDKNKDDMFELFKEFLIWKQKQ
jgi:hypothetical protein